jgi:hypothetical protein
MASTTKMTDTQLISKILFWNKQKKGQLISNAINVEATTLLFVTAFENIFISINKFIESLNLLEN